MTNALGGLPNVSMYGAIGIGFGTFVGGALLSVVVAYHRRRAGARGVNLNSQTMMASGSTLQRAGTAAGEAGASGGYQPPQQQAQATQQQQQQQQQQQAGVSSQMAYGGL